MNINTAGIDTNTVTITDYKVLSNKLAKVIISFTGKHDRKSICEAIAKQTNNMAAVVENSFRMVKAGVAVGFLRANKEVKVVSDNELRASYRVMSSNILMDNKDKTLWEVRQGAGGKYLARHGHEDLSELIETCAKSRTDVPSLRMLAKATAATNEFVAFVSASGDVEYGFCTGVRDDAIRVLSTTTRMDVIVPKEQITASFEVKVPKELHRQVVTAGGLTPGQKAKAKEYWRELYSYDPAYLREVERNVEEGTLA